MATILGQANDARALVDAYEDRMDEPVIWLAALVASRASGVSIEDDVAWAYADNHREQYKGDVHLPLRYIFIARTLDRRVEATTAQLLESLELRATHRGLNGAGSTTYYDRTFRRRTSDLPVGNNERVLGAAPFLVRMELGMVAIEAHDYARAYAVLNEAVTRYELREFLPYYAWAAAKNDTLERILPYLEKRIEKASIAAASDAYSQGELFDEYLSMAFIQGAAGDHDAAIDYLKRANTDGAHPDERHVLPRYQLVQAAEYLYDDSGVKAYRDFALDHARRFSIVEPYYAWTHSYVAMLSDNSAERTVALARVLTLDPESRSVDVAEPAELARAREIANNGYPMPSDAVAQTL